MPMQKDPNVRFKLINNFMLLTALILLNAERQTQRYPKAVVFVNGGFVCLLYDVITFER